MKQDYTLHIFRTDRRYKTGERLFTTVKYLNRDDNEMRSVVAGLFDKFDPDAGWRFDWTPSKMTVKNLMTGADVEIDRDTPWCCNPASESYWSA
jgi:hypothetical protein